MKKIIFHVGFHKTGSTSIQNWLDSNSSVLQNEIHIYNLTDGSTGQLKLSANQFDISGFTDENLNRFKKACIALERQVLSYRQDKVLYTDEQLFGMPLGFSFGNKNRVQREIYPNAQQIFKLICEHFHNFQVEFIIYKRENKAWFKSIWNQMYKQKATALSFEEYASEMKIDHTIGELATEIKHLSNKLDNVDVHVIDFESDFSFGQVWDMEFFKILELSNDTKSLCDAALPNKNKSIKIK